jgi:hypothetical protein
MKSILKSNPIVMNWVQHHGRAGFLENLIWTYALAYWFTFKGLVLFLELLCWIRGV